MSAPLVRVIVVNYNAGGYLRRCLDALRMQEMGFFEAVIVDNASTDSSAEEVPEDPRFKVERLPTNIGFAAANNLAARGAVTPFLAMLNPDAIPAVDWLSRLLEAAAAAPEAQLFGSLQLQDDDPERIDGAGDAYYFAGTAWRLARGAPRRVARFTEAPFGACAAAALIRTEWFNRLDGFDEDYFCYFEDVDLAFRLRLLGGSVRQANNAVVRHAGSAAGASSDFVLRHVTRNQIWTFAKAMPGPLFIPLLPVHVALITVKWIVAAHEGRGRVYGSAVLEALRAWRAVVGKRHRAQSDRVASTLAIARVMTWSWRAFRARKA